MSKIRIYLAPCCFCGELNGNDCLKWPGACVDKKKKLSAEDLALKHGIKVEHNETIPEIEMQGGKLCNENTKEEE